MSYFDVGAITSAARENTQSGGGLLGGLTRAIKGAVTGFALGGPLGAILGGGLGTEASLSPSTGRAFDKVQGAAENLATTLRPNAVPGVPGLGPQTPQVPPIPGAPPIGMVPAP